MTSINGSSFTKGEGTGTSSKSGTSLILKTKKEELITLTADQKIEKNKKVTLAFDKGIFSFEDVLLQIKLVGGGLQFRINIRKNSAFGNFNQNNVQIYLSNVQEEDKITKFQNVSSNGNFTIEIKNSLNGQIKLTANKECKKTINSTKDLTLSILLKNQSQKEAEVKFLDYTIA